LKSIILALNDLKLFFRDRWSLLYVFVLPIALVTIFSLIFGSAGEVSKIPEQLIPVVDLDHSPESNRLITALNDMKQIEVERVTGKDGALSRVKEGKRVLALVIEPGFGEALAHGEVKDKLKVYYDPAKELEYAIVSGSLYQVVWNTFPEHLISSFAGSAINEMEMPEEDRKRAFSSIGEYISKKKKEGFSPSAINAMFSAEPVVEVIREKPGVAQSAAGTAVMMLLFSVIYGGATILREKEVGILKRLLFSPISMGTILIGRYLSLFAIGAIQLTVLFLFVNLAFGLPLFLHLFPLVFFSGVTVAAASSFGIFLASLSRSYRQVEGLGTLIVLVMSALGGSWFPLFLMPRFMQKLGHFTFNAWAMDGYQEIFFRGGGISDILLEIFVLSAICLVTITISVVIFSRRSSREFLAQ
jgi:ABC-2 type transport system permease protein